MSLANFYIPNKKFWWPVILPLAFFLVFLGMRPPVLPKPQKPHVHFRAVVETQSKDTKAKSCAQKCWDCAELPPGTEIVGSPVFSARAPFSRERRSTPPLISTAPSRAPPASNA